MKRFSWPSAPFLALTLLSCTFGPGKADAADTSVPALTEVPKGFDYAIYAGGCFWCAEAVLEKVPGVLEVQSGYTGGAAQSANYKLVSYGNTKHTEAVRVVYDPARVSYRALTDAFLRGMDPTDVGGQFADRGSQYRPGIYVRDAAQRRYAEAALKALKDSKKFSKPINTPVEKEIEFYAAENYHQDYYKKNTRHYERYFAGSGRKAFIEKHWGAPKKYAPPSQSVLEQELTPMQFKVTQKDGTEPPFKNAYFDNKKVGIYVDITSGEPLFASSDKFKSGTGWPSYWRPLVAANVVEKVDRGYGMVRVEVRSKHGDAHLGHVFNDGPAPTGKRYCINSAALRFVPKDKMKAEGYGAYLGYLSN